MRNLINFKDMYLINSFRYKDGFDQQGKYTFQELDDLINIEGYIPVATGGEFDGIRNTTPKTMGLGTPWEDTYITGGDKKYVQINNISLSAFTDFPRIALSGIYDGNLVNINDFSQLSASTGDGLFECGATTGDRTIRNLIAPNANITVSGVTTQVGVITGAPVLGWLIEDCKTGGTITSTGGGWLGGIAGHSYATVRRCESSVTITNTGGSQLYYGGLIGILRAGGTIENCYATGNVTGNRYVGSLTGYNLGGTITNSYGIGILAASLDGGGLMGANTGIVTNCYWDTDTTGYLTSAAGSGKTTTEMKQGVPSVDIYTGWSLSTWDFGTTNDYPTLL